jgi:hypothetical protein
LSREFKRGTIVLHPEFGSGRVVSNSDQRIEVEFKLRGRKALDRDVGERLLTETGYNPPTPLLPRTEAIKLEGKSRRKKSKEKGSRRKKKQKHAKKKGLQIGVRSGRAGGDRWEWDMTTPNTPLWRQGRR